MKHGVIIVLSLILALCLMGVVSADENVTVDCDDIQITQEDISIEAVENSEMENEIYSDDNSSSLNDDLNNELCYSNAGEISELENSDLSYSKEVNYTVELNEIDDKNTENVLNEKIDSPDGYVTYNNGNLLMLPLNDLNSESLTITFNNGAKKLLLSGDDGLTDNSWNNFPHAGINSEITSQSIDKKPFYTGFISNQDNYPQRDLPLGDTSNDLLGISRDSDDDAFIWSAENPDEKAYLSVDMVNETSEDVLKSNISDMENDLSFRLGRNASLKALDYFKSKGIYISEDYPYLYVLTSASKVNLSGSSTYGAIIGIAIVLGDGLNKNIFPLHNPLWQDLIFYYIWVSSTDKTDMYSYALKYDETSSRLIESGDVKAEGDKIAYDMGLYEKKPDDKHHDKDSHKKHTPHSKHLIEYEKMIGIDQFADANDVNSTNNNTNVTNATVSENKDDIAKNSVSYSGNPFNLLYIIISIIMVSIIFGVGYSKRNS